MDNQSDEFVELEAEADQQLSAFHDRVYELDESKRGVERRIYGNCGK